MEEKLRILYQDEYYIGIYKPSGLLVHRTQLDKHETRFCLQILRDQLGREVYPCHRLDKPTSGVMLFALDKEALKAANELFAESKIEKVYHGIVRGWIEAPGRLDYALKPEDKEEDAKADSTQLQEAVTVYSPLEKFEVEKAVGRYETARYSLVELIPETGRRHQLRRHLAHLRHPLIGDSRHGDGVQNAFFREEFGCDRLLLTALSLCLDHPFTGELLRIESAPDSEFMRILEALSQ